MNLSELIVLIDKISIERNPYSGITPEGGLKSRIKLAAKISVPKKR